MVTDNEYLERKQEEPESETPLAYKIMKPIVNAPPMVDYMMTLSKLEIFKYNHVEDNTRIKERTLRQDIYMDPHLDTQIKGQIVQMDLNEDPRSRFPNMMDVCKLVLKDLQDYGDDARIRGGLFGETYNTKIVTSAMLPIYGFDSKSVTFWFKHQKVFRHTVCQEVEEMLMINKFINMRPDWIDYHDQFWALSDQAMSALNVLAFLIYSLNVPVDSLAVPLWKWDEIIENYYESSANRDLKWITWFLGNSTRILPLLEKKMLIELKNTN